MSNIVPLDNTAALPAYLKNRDTLAEINREVLTVGPSFPVLSIKGKIFTLVKGGEKKVITRVVDGEEEPAPHVTLTVIRANVSSRQYYAKGYIDGESDGNRPTCYSQDGVAPSPYAAEPQAKKCGACPHAVWGSRVAQPGDEGGKGTACTPRTRLAVIDPNKPEMPFLLGVPAGSKKNFSEVVKVADNRSIPYNALVLRVGFDPEAPSPRLTFKPIGVVNDELYGQIKDKYNSDEIKEIVGLLEVAPPVTEAPEPAAPKVSTDELDAALAAKAVEKAKATAKVESKKEEPKPAPAAKPKAENKPTQAASDASALLGELDALLDAKDD